MKKIIKISAIILAVLLLIGGAVGALVVYQKKMEARDFLSPDRMVTSVVTDGEIVERELSRTERREVLNLLGELYSARELDIRINADANSFFAKYEQYGAIKFLYHFDQQKERIDSKYCGCGVYNGEESKLHIYNEIYFVVTDKYVFAYEGYNGTLQHCIGIYWGKAVDNQEFYSKYFPQKEG